MLRHHTVPILVSDTYEQTSRPVPRQTISTTEGSRTLQLLGLVTSWVTRGVLEAITSAGVNGVGLKCAGQLQSKIENRK